MIVGFQGGRLRRQPGELNLVWSDARPAVEIATFAEAFGRDLKFFNSDLIGGDTTSTPGPLVIEIV